MKAQPLPGVNYIRHKAMYEFWRIHDHNDSETGREFERTRQYIGKLREEEYWEREADAADAAVAQSMVEAEELARQTAYRAIQQGLDNAVALQSMITLRIPTSEADGQDVQAASGALRAAMLAADTMYNWSKIKVEHSGEVGVHSPADALASEMAALLTQQGITVVEVTDIGA
jgi:hypothetical protein